VCRVDYNDICTFGMAMVLLLLVLVRSSS
jgi:hypothetical protein